MPPADVSVLWFRRDLRVRDHPALVAAAEHARCVPVFVFDPRLLTEGRFPSAIRTRFMLGCLAELDGALRERGGKLVVRHGRPEEVLPELCAQLGAQDLYFTADVAPWARARDARVVEALGAVRSHPMPGACVVDEPAAVLTGQDKPYSVFSPFARTWRTVPRRAVLPAPRTVDTPANVQAGALPDLAALGLPEPPSPGTFAPGETAARTRMTAFLKTGLEQYADARDAPKGGSSRLSPYLRWGCLSALELDARVADLPGDGPADYRTELAWRDFYAAILIHFPFVVRDEFQERYRGTLAWEDPAAHLAAWTAGMTGYPLVDAGMRQLAHEGWMHNRVRMVVGSFLTKDLHLDWREGERVFMERLVDGDMAANNGGWQWIASTGADPKPYFQRLFNPVTQHEKFDPDGEYVRRWVPELERVPAPRLSKPWTMSDAEQEAAGCRIGVDYPSPIVDHAEERRRAVERYRAVGAAD